MPTAKAKVKKRNPQDATIRNVRVQRRMDLLHTRRWQGQKARIATFRQRLADLEDRVDVLDERLGNVAKAVRQVDAP